MSVGSINMLQPLFLLSCLTTALNAQESFLNTTGPTTRASQCSTITAPTQPSFTFGNFSFSLSTTLRTATLVAAASATTTYAPPASIATSVLTTSVSYTTWGNWDPTATANATDTNNPYGNYAWTLQWQSANPPNYTAYTSLYSTTVSPTPVPSSQLVLPPSDYFGPTDCYNFPSGFMFGVAGSASQIEGAVAQQGKAPTLIDLLIRNSEPKDYVTNENYYLYKQDITRLAAMGVKYYSFSISWARILPFALPGTPVNQYGLDHYDDLINFILAQGMIPVATLLHFDTPLSFYAANLSATASKPLIGYDNGMYQNQTFPAAFLNYAQIAMSHYADRVPVWFTFNEPLLYSDNGQSVYNVLKSHASVYHWYKEVLNGTGKISFKLNDNFGVPRDPSDPADVYAANHFNSFQLGTFGNPVFLGQDYPDSFKQTVPDYVPLNATDLAYLNGTADFLGIDPYTATVVTPPTAGDTNSITECASNSSNPDFPYCVNQTTVTRYGSWDIGYRSESYVYTTPTFLRLYLSYLYNTFLHPIVITEFGFPVFAESQKELPDQLFDSPRSQYYLSYLSEVLKSIWEDGVDVQGAFAWSFVDNWEFGTFDSMFGLQTVNRTTQERRYKKSFFDIVDFVAARTVG